MGRSPCCEKDGLKKGPWTPEEDRKLLAYIEQHGIGFWHSVPAKAGLQRCRKSCRLRWNNYLRPDIKRGKFSLGEEQTIIQLHALLGNRWSAIAAHLPKRTGNDIKNHWNTHLKKRLAKKGIDPVTHKPARSDAPRTSGAGGADGGGGATVEGAPQHAKQSAARLSCQSESTRLEAEARKRQASQRRALAASATASISTPAPQMTSPADGGGATVLGARGATALAVRAAVQMQPIMPAYEEVSPHKDHLQQQWGDHFIDVADADILAVGFAKMHLDESLQEKQTEEEKKYWVGIMKLVNSPAPEASQQVRSASLDF